MKKSVFSSSISGAVAGDGDSSMSTTGTATSVSSSSKQPLKTSGRTGSTKAGTGQALGKVQSQQQKGIADWLQPQAVALEQQQSSKAGVGNIVGNKRNIFSCTEAPSRKKKTVSKGKVVPANQPSIEELFKKK